MIMQIVDNIHLINKRKRNYSDRYILKIPLPLQIFRFVPQKPGEIYENDRYQRNHIIPDIIGITGSFDVNETGVTLL